MQNLRFRGGQTAGDHRSLRLQQTREGGVIMSHPKRKSSRFNEDLLPRSIVNSIEYWLTEGFLPDGPFKFNVQTLLSKFRTEFAQYVSNADECQLPAMMKSCKQRASLLSDFCQKVIILLHKGYLCYPITKDYQLIKSNFKIRFSKSIIGTHPDGQLDDVIEEINITNNPRMYRYLYYMVLESLMAKELRPEDQLFICLIAQSEAYIFESVNLTDQEIIEAEQEFLAAAESEDCWSDDSHLAKIMEEVSQDMRKPNPPKYISDFKQVRRSHDGYMYNHPWTIDDAWYSTSSSGSSLTWNGRVIPNIGLLYSALESDQPDPIDNIIGYKNLYPNETFPGLVQRTSTTITVPKTSSRGRRVIHMNYNGRQDRGSYFENMCKHTLSNVVKCDTTFPLPGHDGTEFIRSFKPSDNRVLICTDMKAATDMISHQFLLRFWNILFKEGCAESLLRIHSGEGIFRLHSIENGKLTLKEQPYIQRSGIKCGTRSNFAVGLTYCHNFILRCTMKYLGWEDVDPSTLYVVHGDDNALALPLDSWRKFLDAYIMLAAEAGFRVHPIEEKGMISFPSDLMYRAEYNKQVWCENLLVSRIPHKLFFANDTVEKKFQIIQWLSQYKYLDISGQSVRELLIRPYFVQEEKACAAWNFLVDKKLFGLPSHLRIQLVDDLSDTESYNLAIQMFIQTISTGMYDVILNNRHRLSQEQVRKKVEQQTLLFEDEEFLNTAIQWQNDHCPGIGKLEYTVQKNRRFADELRTLFNDPFIWAHSLLGFFTLEEKELIMRCLPYARLSLDIDLSMIDQFIQVSKILSRTQPHSINKRTRTSTSTIVKTLRSYLNGLENPNFYS